jgi:hypothetical protein
MAIGTAWRSNTATYDHPDFALSARPQRLLAGVALVCITFACSWTLYSNVVGAPAGPVDVSGTRGDRLLADITGSRGDRLGATAAKTATPASATASTSAPASSSTPASASAQAASPSQRLAKAKAALTNFALLFDPRFSGTAPGTFTGTAPAQPHGWQVASAAPQAAQPSGLKVASIAPNAEHSAAGATMPVPQPAPVQTRSAALHDAAHHLVAKAAADTRTIFEKLFGKPLAAPVTLAYADADGATTSDGGIYDHTTAVYDISAHTVYLPDGTTLEAHSGLGALLDDPSHADARDRGVTPPTLYDLKPREALFHGVQALRLIPVEEGTTYGRSGLLAHTYMLGPKGDSNGCVSFRDYNAFLDAYESHKITRLAVVTHLD